MTVGFTLSTFVVVESLEDGEPLTGKATAQYLAGLIETHSAGFDVRYEVCRSVSDFRSVASQLEIDARELGLRPLLHIECHGSETLGLEFSDGTILAWNELGDLLSTLNIATDFNLFVVVAACYGAYLTGQFSALTPAPAFCITAPTREISPPEILRAFREFYRELVQTGDVGVAVAALTQIRTSQGEWFSQLAESWFKDLMINYVQNHLSHSALHDWARKFSRTLRDEGQLASVGGTARRLRALHKANLPGKYFDAFFCTNALPGTAQRFAESRKQVEVELSRLKATGLYAL